MIQKIFKFYLHIKTFLFPLFLLILVVIFYYPTFLQNKLPIPSDTIVGLYHPYRDLYDREYPRGIPYKNFLITDPVRQTFVWKELATSSFKKMELPLWNPYEMAGKPLLANFQSGVFYPLNILFVVLPFTTAWTVFIVLQSVFMGLFMYLYLRNLRLSFISSFLGSIALIFSSFSVVWLEWGNIIHAFLWLPLILLAVDKLFQKKDRYLFFWGILYVLALLSAFFAGYLQTFFYMFVISIFYFVLRLGTKNARRLLHFILLNTIFVLLSFIQWYPTYKFILLSARSIDQNYLVTEGWFIPFKHLIQFVAPDFFGNPTTLNYWGMWNYAELGGYIGIVSLMLVPFAFFIRRKLVMFFTAIVFSGLLFATDNLIARIPFQLDIPLISSSQPTRLLSIILFSLAVLASFGMEYVLNIKRKFSTLFPLAIWLGVVLLLWSAVFLKSPLLFDDQNVIAIAKRNLFLPTALILSSSLLFFALAFFKNKTFRAGIIILIFVFLSFDLLRYSWKFTPFTKSEYLFPQTKIISFLQNDKSIFRVAATDQRIMPPNFLTHYRIQTLEGYDPLYLRSYAEFIASMERGKPDINPPFGFNRIITPHNVNSSLMDSLNVKYILSFDELTDSKFKKIMVEGRTKLYENTQSFPRAYFVKSIDTGSNNQIEIEKIHKVDLENVAILSQFSAPGEKDYTKGEARIKLYSENKVVIETQNIGTGFLVLADSFYPSWKATIDGSKTTIYPTNYIFRGVVVPAGKHTVEFSITLF